MASRGRDEVRVWSVSLGGKAGDLLGRRYPEARKRPEVIYRHFDDVLEEIMIREGLATDPEFPGVDRRVALLHAMERVVKWG